MGFSLSRRLAAAAEMVSSGNRVVDIGTDHAYLPIWLVSEGVCPSAIAADLRKGPLLAASAHVREAGLDGRVSLRLSDGLKKIACGEAETITITGMGGPLICRILADSEEVVRSAKELILSPQSDVPDVRRFLLGHRLLITDETMVYEDGKFYVIIKACPDHDASDVFGGLISEDGSRDLETSCVKDSDDEDSECGKGGKPDEDSECGKGGKPDEDSECGKGGKPDEDSECGKGGKPDEDSESGKGGKRSEKSGSATEGNARIDERAWSEEELAYGRFLIRKRPQAFLDYLDWRIGKLKDICAALSRENTDKAKLRLAEMEAELALITRIRQ